MAAIVENISQSTISLVGVRFTAGITYDATLGSQAWLASGEVIVLTENIAEFTAMYGAIPQLAGQYSGALSNGGETLTLLAADNSTIQSFTYDDQGGGWHASTDGGGDSLTVLRTGGNYNSPSNWRPSFVAGGTPGIEENDAPIDILFSGDQVPEHASNALVAILSVDDPDDFETAIFKLLSNGDADEFVILGNELRVGPVGLNSKAGNTRSVTVQVTDASGATYDEAFIITVRAAIGGDFNHDELYNLLDIDLLIAAIASGNHNPNFDLTNDSFVNLSDRDTWLTQAGDINLGPGQAYRLGDANLDAVVSISDFNIWNANKFTSVAAWSRGDFNADGAVDVSDFNIWNANRFTEVNSTVPRPQIGAEEAITRRRRHCPRNSVFDREGQAASWSLAEVAVAYVFGGYEWDKVRVRRQDLIHLEKIDEIVPEWDGR